MDNEEGPQKVSVRSAKNTNATLDSNTCLFCNEIDNPNELIAMHASSSKVKKVHVDNFTNNLKDMASFLRDSNLMPKLCTGDVISNELFYHKNCYLNYRNKYRNALIVANKTVPSLRQEEDYQKAASFNKIMAYIYEKEQEQENVLFDVSELEELYYNQLSLFNIQYTKHVSRFADKLASSIPELEIRRIKRKLTVFFKQRVDSYVLNEILEPNSFLQSVNKVV